MAFEIFFADIFPVIELCEKLKDKEPCEKELNNLSKKLQGLASGAMLVQKSAIRDLFNALDRYLRENKQPVDSFLEVIDALKQEQEKGIESFQALEDAFFQSL